MADPKRVAVPLVMIEGNLDILLNNRMPCEAVSLHPAEDSENGVVLHFHGIDREEADRLGFKTVRRISE